MWSSGHHEMKEAKIASYWITLQHCIWPRKDTGDTEASPLKSMTKTFSLCRASDQYKDMSNLVNMSAINTVARALGA